MKKRMLLFICVFTSFVHAMESNSWSLLYHGTTINITIGPLFDADNKVDLIVVGKNQQHILRDSSYDNLHTDLGRIEYPENKIIYVKNKNSAHDTFQPNKQLRAHKKEMQTKVLSITEPIITENCYTTTFILLTTCYAHIFEEGLKELKDKEEKRIAFPLLGSATTGVSKKKAIEASTIGINTFIKENPTAYSLIEIFVEKKSEAIKCRQLFNKLQNILDEVTQKGY
jgi:hypothetical protein